MKRMIDWLVALGVGLSLYGLTPFSRADVAPMAPAASQDLFHETGSRAGAAAIREHVESIVSDTVISYLHGAGIREQGVKVMAMPVTDQQDKVQSLQVQINITTDLEHPDQVGRETRQAVQRALIDDGYRMDPPGTESTEVSPEILARPIAKILLTVDYPKDPRRWTERLAFRPILVFMALICLMVLGFSLCIWMSRRMWRAWLRQPVRPATVLQEVLEGEALIPTGDGQLPPLPERTLHIQPAIEILPPPASVPVVGTDRNLPQVPNAFESDHDATAKQALIATFAEMPFEKAVRALSAFDAVSRTAIIEKLGLHQAVRRRLEAEVAELTRS